MSSGHGRALALVASVVLGVGGCSTPPGATGEPAVPSAAGTTASASPAAAWADLPAAEGIPRDRALRVAFLIVDGVYNTELVAPFDVFHHVQFHATPGMEVCTVSPTGAAVRTFEGLEVGADYSLETAPAPDVLVVPSAEHSMDTDLGDTSMIEWVHRVGSEASFVLSLCDGAFVLAKAGLLDGKAATTFPSDQDRFAEMFPAVRLERGVSFVHDGAAVTSEGGAKSFDAAMYLVDRIYGQEVAHGVGGGLLIPWPPAPGAFTARVVSP